MFCRKCGMKLNDGEMICPQCGQAASRCKLENSTQQDSAQEQSLPPKDQNIYLQGQPSNPQQSQYQPYQPQGQPYQPQQGNSGQQGYAQNGMPQPAQQSGPWLQNWVASHQLDKGHAIGIVGCVMLFLSIFMTLVYVSALGYQEKATLQQYFTDVMDQPSFTPVMGICAIAAAALFFCNRVTLGTLVGVAGALLGFIGLFSAWSYLSETEYASTMHTGIGGYMVIAGAVLALVPQVRKVNRQNHY